ncbi:LysR family transcriptional regulator [Stigmatella erecta]|uniref:Transcriptional regulator, LysR family n=1 Tax=Stigmatella erecta TaxID=83460 RepID=A0A1I0LD58_9BACT|nr:LysR family transcriptional regulator [Stigmatella erecta]SEU38070.1 transcriptional regulator, LysR family [Stigmatella erecta]
MNTALLPQLQMFLTVARLRSFSGAARELGVSTPAVSQAVRHLEKQLRVVLLTRTTRSVSLTDSGRRLVEGAGPAMGQALTALTEVSAQPGETVGRVRLSVPQAAVPYVIDPVLPTFRARHPRVEVEVNVENRFVDIVAEGYDAGVRLSEAIERDMVQVRLTAAFRFVVVGSSGYLERHGTPQRPEDLLRHECITFRLPNTGALYAWELERGRRNWRVPVRGGVVTNDSQLSVSLAEQGLGLAYAFEPKVVEHLRSGRLQQVLEPYAPTVPGFFLYFPSRAQRSPALRLFVDVARELTTHTARLPPGGS